MHHVDRRLQTGGSSPGLRPQDPAPQAADTMRPLGVDDTRLGERARVGCIGYGTTLEQADPCQTETPRRLGGDAVGGEAPGARQ